MKITYKMEIRKKNVKNGQKCTDKCRLGNF